MKPSFYNYALSHTCAFATTAGAFLALGLMLHTLQQEGVLIANLGVVVYTVIAAVPAAAIGWILGFFFLWPYLGCIASRLQGGPFHVGDPIWILVGEHRGKLTHVYDVWEERGQVRVDLGLEAKEKYTDVFCTVAICRANNNEPRIDANERQS